RGSIELLPVKAPRTWFGRSDHRGALGVHQGGAPVGCGDGTAGQRAENSDAAPRQGSKGYEGPADHWRRVGPTAGQGGDRRGAGCDPKLEVLPSRPVDLWLASPRVSGAVVG